MGPTHFNKNVSHDWKVYGNLNFHFYTEAYNLNWLTSTINIPYLSWRLKNFRRSDRSFCKIFSRINEIFFIWSIKATFSNQAIQITTLSSSLGGSSSHDPTRSMDYTACATVVLVVYLSNSSEFFKGGHTFLILSESKVSPSFILLMASILPVYIQANE